MASRLMLTLHTAIFASFVAASLSSPFLAFSDPDIFSGTYPVVGAIALLILVPLSWRIAGGCPFTVWENRLRLREGKAEYEGACIDHYAREWFGLTVASGWSTRALVALLIIPIAASLAVNVA